MGIFYYLFSVIARKTTKEKQLRKELNSLKRQIKLRDKANDPGKQYTGVYHTVQLVSTWSLAKFLSNFKNS